MDGLNYMNKFLNVKDKHWKYKISASKINKFAKEIKKDYDLIVFFDWSRTSKETQEKWRTRREQSFRKGVSQIPQDFQSFIQRIFKQQGVQTYNCIEDGDDTVANWAFNNQNAIIMSNDKDYFRYVSEDGKYNFYSGYKNYPYQISTSFSYDKQQKKYILDMITNNLTFYITRSNKNIVLTPKNEEDKHKQKKLEMRILTKELFQVSTDQSILDLELYHAKKLHKKGEKHMIYKGCGSDLIKKYGSPHYIIKPLIAQLYYKKGINFPIQHTFIIPDPENPEEPIWVQENIYPDKNDHWIKDPMQSAQKLGLFQEVPLDLSEKEQLEIVKHNVNVLNIINRIIEELNGSSTGKTIPDYIINIDTEQILKKVNQKQDIIQILLQ